MSPSSKDRPTNRRVCITGDKTMVRTSIAIIALVLTIALPTVAFASTNNMDAGNTGTNNIGNGNSGNHNIGNGNSGNNNRGNNNSGDNNRGNNNSGDNNRGNNNA